LIVASRIRDLHGLIPRSSGFVPTMGALHKGHLDLVRAAKETCGHCVVSVFVNPTQFGPNEDFNRYPRDLDRDVELAKSAGADVVFAPSTEEIYGTTRTWVKVEGITDHFEGAFRPGHFDGVATVVAKLFHIVSASHAFFGLKDLQQCAVIDRMVRDLNMPITLEFVETTREEDGLAMSSRNRYLTPEQRAIAPNLYQELITAKAAILEGNSVAHVLEEGRIRIQNLGFRIDYYELVNLADWLPATNVSQKSAIVTAAKIGDTRLIDNIIVNGSL